MRRLLTALLALVALLGLAVPVAAAPPPVPPGPPAGTGPADRPVADAVAEVQRRGGVPAWLADQLDGLTIPEAQRRMAAGELSSLALTGAYLLRIAAVDPALGAVVAVDPTAPAQAVRADVRRRTGRSLGPLDGIPVLLKDNIDTRRRPATAGSRALVGTPRTADAALVRRLRDAGAVVLGAANLSEWANFRSTRSTSGWSAVGGQTANPHVLDRNPCGSSSGSATAVAASLAQVAVGTETDGSIVCPAGATGIVGHKPSLGLVSRTGVVPISAEQDTAGPMARHVVDAAITLSALQGRDPADPATAAYPADQPTDYAALLDTGVLAGARLGVWRNAGADAGVDAVVAQTVATLEAAGATVVEVELPYQDTIGELEFPALVSEFRRDLEAYLAARPGGPDTLAELVEFNRADPVELDPFGQEIFEQARTAPPADDPAVQEQRRTARDLARRSIDETLAAADLDAVVAPTNSPAWVTDYARGDAFVLGSSSPAAVAGYPNASVPAGSVGPLPVGVSFFGPQWADARVLSLAAAFEAAAGARRAPGYLPTCATECAPVG